MTHMQPLIYPLRSPGLTRTSLLKLIYSSQIRHRHSSSSSAFVLHLTRPISPRRVAGSFIISLQPREEESIRIVDTGEQLQIAAGTGP